jgi:hypothetical protein
VYTEKGASKWRPVITREHANIAVLISQADIYMLNCRYGLKHPQNGYSDMVVTFFIAMPYTPAEPMPLFLVVH